MWLLFAETEDERLAHTYNISNSKPSDEINRKMKLYTHGAVQ